MYKIALKMLIEDRAKFIGMVLSLSLSAIIITQQSAIFLGVMERTFSMISDTPQPEIWVMDPNTKYIDDIMPMRDTDLYRIRGIKGVKWAVPYFKGIIQARLPNGHIETCNIVGIDEVSLIGAPYKMREGNVHDLRNPDAIIVNYIGATEKLNTGKCPLRVGQDLELNDRRAVVVGICDSLRTFRSQPVIYTTYNRALTYSPLQRKMLSLILVKSDETISQHDLCKRISTLTPFKALTKKEFEQLTHDYYQKNTGIPINFGIAIMLGILVGAAIAGQIFYNFIADNLKYLALFVAMGASEWLLVKMAAVQALLVAFLGWGIGSGGAAVIGFFARNTELSFLLTWKLFLGTACIILLICLLALIISVSKIFKIELWTMFK